MEGEDTGSWWKGRILAVADETIYRQEEGERMTNNFKVSIALITYITCSLILGSVRTPVTSLYPPSSSSSLLQFILHNAAPLLQVLSVLSLVRLVYHSQPRSILWDGLAVTVLAVGGFSRYWQHDNVPACQGFDVRVRCMYLCQCTCTTSHRSNNTLYGTYWYANKLPLIYIVSLLVYLYNKAPSSIITWLSLILYNVIHSKFFAYWWREVYQEKFQLAAHALTHSHIQYIRTYTNLLQQWWILVSHPTCSHFDVQPFVYIAYMLCSCIHSLASTTTVFLGVCKEWLCLSG